MQHARVLWCAATNDPLLHPLAHSRPSVCGQCTVCISLLGSVQTHTYTERASVLLFDLSHIILLSSSMALRSSSHQHAARQAAPASQPTLQLLPAVQCYTESTSELINPPPLSSHPGISLAHYNLTHADRLAALCNALHPEGEKQTGRTVEQTGAEHIRCR